MRLLIVQMVLVVAVFGQDSGFVVKTDMDATWNIQCPENQAISKLESYHKNFYEDRAWTISCAGNINHGDCIWTGFVNNWDEKVDYSCGERSFLAGIASEHSNRAEDRRWKFRCCELPEGTDLVDCTFPPALNALDGSMDYTVPEGMVIRKMMSVHDNFYEDRIFNVEICKLGQDSGFVVNTDYDVPWNIQCPENQAISSLKSVHDNNKEDRAWTIACAGNINHGACTWTDFVNNWDEKVDYSCGERSFLAGIASEYNNQAEDRRWKFRCCELPEGMSLRNCAFPPALNDWDGPMDYTVPDGMIIRKMMSVHDNKKEDRIFNVQICKVGAPFPRCF